MSGCDRCVELQNDLFKEQKRSTELSNALQSIYRVAKEKMWYPSTFEVRGESGYRTSEAYVAADREAFNHDGYTK